MTFPESRPTGSAQECFHDLITKYPNLEMIKFIADFCGVTAPTVQGWQLGSGLPGGISQLRLRCLLHVAGYQIQELQKLKGPVRSLALMVGSGVVTPVDAESALEYTRNLHSAHNSLWRILVAGGGFQTDVGEKIGKLVRKHKRELDDRLSAIATELTAIIGTPPTQAVRQTSREVPAGIDPTLVVTAFSRAISLATALGQTMLEHDLQADVRDATRGGQDLIELGVILDKLSPTLD